jgi:hypothetical protein
VCCSSSREHAAARPAKGSVPGQARQAVHEPGGGKRTRSPNSAPVMTNATFVTLLCGAWRGRRRRQPASNETKTTHTRQARRSFAAAALRNATRRRRRRTHAPA